MGSTWVDDVRRLTTPAETRAWYERWAPTYDADVDPDTAGEARDYAAPELVAERVAALVDPGADVLDAACGTGLVGDALARRGFTSLDGLDLSPAMVARARRRRVYHDLGPADLGHRVPGASDKFDVVTCAGGLGYGHLRPSAVTELARVVRPGGYVVATVLADDWEPLGVGRFLARLEAAGTVRVDADEPRPFLRRGGVTCRLLVLGVRTLDARTDPAEPRGR